MKKQKKSKTNSNTRAGKAQKPITLVRTKLAKQADVQAQVPSEPPAILAVPQARRLLNPFLLLPILPLSVMNMWMVQMHRGFASSSRKFFGYSALR